MNRACELLQTAYNAFAPLEAQKGMIETLETMIADNEPDEAIAVTIASALADGLQYRNWGVSELSGLIISNPTDHLYLIALKHRLFMEKPISADDQRDIANRLELLVDRLIPFEGYANGERV